MQARTCLTTSLLRRRTEDRGAHRQQHHNAHVGALIAAKLSALRRQSATTGQQRRSMSTSAADGVGRPVVVGGAVVDVVARPHTNTRMKMAATSNPGLLRNSPEGSWCDRMNGLSVTVARGWWCCALATVICSDSVCPARWAVDGPIDGYMVGSRCSVAKSSSARSQ